MPPGSPCTRGGGRRSRGGRDAFRLASMDDGSTPDPGGTPLARILLAVAVALALGLGGLALYLTRSAPRPPAPPATGAETPAQRRARLAAIGEDQKNAWVDEIPGIDASGLDPARREVFLRFANAQRCTCGCGFTLAACRRYDSECDVSGPRVQRLLDSVAAGLVRDAEGVRERPAASRP